MERHYSEQYFFSERKGGGKTWTDKEGKVHKFGYAGGGIWDFKGVYDKLAEILGKPESVLDLGSGCGGWPATLSNLGIDALGLEFSHFAIENCLPSAQKILKLWDLASTPWPVEKQYDWITMWDLGEHIFEADIDMVIAEAKRVTKHFIVAKICTAQLPHEVWVAEKGTLEEVLAQGHRDGYDWLTVSGHVNSQFCYDDLTEVLTEDGFKLFKDVTAEDKIATLNDEGYLEYHRALQKQVFQYKGEMIHWEGRHYDLKVTPNHHLLVRRHNGLPNKKLSHNPFEFVEAKDVASKSGGFGIYEMKRDAIWNGADVNEFVLPLDDRIEAYKNLEKWTGSLISFSKKHGISYRTIRRWRKKQTKPNNICLEQPIKMDEWLRFLGWWLSEGSIHKLGRTHGTFCVSVPQKATSPYVKDIISCVQGIGFQPSFSYDKASDMVHVRVYRKQLFQALQEFGHARSKYVPKYIKNLSPRQIQIFLDSYCKGDGCFINNKNGKISMSSIYTSSKQMADDIQELLLKAGWAGTINHRLERDAYEVYISDERLTPRVCAKTKIEQYDGYVYDLTVPNHTLYVRRNGRVVWSSNSEYWQKKFEDAEWRLRPDLSDKLKHDLQLPEDWRTTLIVEKQPAKSDLPMGDFTQAYYDRSYFADPDGKGYRMPDGSLRRWGYMNPSGEWEGCKPIVQAWKTMFQPNDLLDSGAGRGQFIVAARDIGIAAVGFDYSEYAVGAGRYVKCKAEWLRLHDATKPWPYLDRHFDLTVCLDTLEHLYSDDLPFAIGELYRVTKKWVFLQVAVSGSGGLQSTSHKGFLLRKGEAVPVELEQYVVAGHLTVMGQGFWEELLKRDEFIMRRDMVEWFKGLVNPVIISNWLKNTILCYERVNDD